MIMPPTRIRLRQCRVEEWRKEERQKSSFNNSMTPSHRSTTHLIRRSISITIIVIIIIAMTHIPHMTSGQDIYFTSPTSPNFASFHALLSLLFFLLTYPICLLSCVLLWKRRHNYPIAGRGAIYLLATNIIILITSPLLTLTSIYYETGVPCGLVFLAASTSVLPLSYCYMIRGWILIFRLEISNYLGALHVRELAQIRTQDAITAAARLDDEEEEEVNEKFHHESQLEKMLSPADEATLRALRAAAGLGSGGGNGVVEQQDTASRVRQQSTSSMSRIPPPLITITTTDGKVQTNARDVIGAQRTKMMTNSSPHTTINISNITHASDDDVEMISLDHGLPGMIPSMTPSQPHGLLPPPDVSSPTLSFNHISTHTMSTNQMMNHLSPAVTPSSSSIVAPVNRPPIIRTSNVIPMNENQMTNGVVSGSKNTNALTTTTTTITPSDGSKKYVALLNNSSWSQLDLDDSSSSSSSTTTSITSMITTNWFLQHRHLIQTRWLLTFILSFSSFIFAVALGIFLYDDPDVKSINASMREMNQLTSRGATSYTLSQLHPSEILYASPCQLSSAKMLYVQFIIIGLLTPMVIWIVVRLRKNAKRTIAIEIAKKRLTEVPISVNPTSSTTITSTTSSTTSSLSHLRSSHPNDTDSVKHELSWIACVAIYIIVAYPILSYFAKPYILFDVIIPLFAIEIITIVHPLWIASKLVRAHRTFLIESRKKLLAGANTNTPGNTNDDPNGLKLTHHRPYYHVRFILRTPHTYPIFLLFLKKEHSEENAHYLVAVKTFQRTCRRLEHQMKEWKKSTTTNGQQQQQQQQLQLQDDNHDGGGVHHRISIITPSNMKSNAVGGGGGKLTSRVHRPSRLGGHKSSIFGGGGTFRSANEGGGGDDERVESLDDTSIEPASAPPPVGISTLTIAVPTSHVRSVSFDSSPLSGLTSIRPPLLGTPKRSMNGGGMMIRTKDAEELSSHHHQSSSGTPTSARRMVGGMISDDVTTMATPTTPAIGLSSRAGGGVINTNNVGHSHRPSLLITGHGGGGGNNIIPQHQKTASVPVGLNLSPSHGGGHMNHPINVASPSHNTFLQQQHQQQSIMNSPTHGLFTPNMQSPLTSPTHGLFASNIQTPIGSPSHALPVGSPSHIHSSHTRNSSHQPTPSSPLPSLLPPKVYTLPELTQLHHDARAMRLACLRIYSEFLRKGASSEINIPDDLHSEVTTHIDAIRKWEPSPIDTITLEHLPITKDTPIPTPPPFVLSTIYKQINMNIYDLLQKDTFRRFILTDHFLDLLIHADDLELQKQQQQQSLEAQTEAVVAAAVHGINQRKVGGTTSNAHAHTPWSSDSGGGGGGGGLKSYTTGNGGIDGISGGGGDTNSAWCSSESDDENEGRNADGDGGDSPKSSRRPSRRGKSSLIHHYPGRPSVTSRSRAAGLVHQLVIPALRVMRANGGVGGDDAALSSLPHQHDQDHSHPVLASSSPHGNGGGGSSTHRVRGSSIHRHPHHQQHHHSSHPHHHSTPSSARISICDPNDSDGEGGGSIGGGGGAGSGGGVIGSINVSPNPGNRTSRTHHRPAALMALVDGEWMHTGPTTAPPSSVGGGGDRTPHSAPRSPGSIHSISSDRVTRSGSTAGIIAIGGGGVVGGGVTAPLSHHERKPSSTKRMGSIARGMQQQQQQQHHQRIPSMELTPGVQPSPRTSTIVVSREPEEPIVETDL